MRIIITGPTGAIGHALIKHCIENGNEVLAICHRGSKRIETLPKDECLSIMELDLCEYEEYCEMHYSDSKRYDVFYHFAWNGTVGEGRNNTDIQSNNIRYALGAVKLASFFGCDTFIGAGSQAEYGRVDGMLRPNTPTFPENSYGIAKLCAGQLTRILCSQMGIKHVWTRILSIYGPYDGEKSMVISSLNKMLNGESVLFTKGEQKWDYLFSCDAARALYLLGLKGIDGKTYVLGSGKVRDLKDYIYIMAKKTGTESELRFGAIPYSDRQVMYLCADIAELEKDIGSFVETDFENGIQKTIDYLREKK